MTAVGSRVAAAITGEDPGLVGPLMGSLTADLLPRDDRAAELFGVRLHRFDAAIERALREWETVEELAGSVACRDRDRGRDQHRHRRAARAGVGAGDGSRTACRSG